jgi:hypothetical protein
VKPGEKNLTPEQKMTGRRPQPVPAGFLVGLPALGEGTPHPATPRTVGEMARALAQALNGPEPVVTGGFRLGDVRHLTADSSRLRADLGW